MSIEAVFGPDDKPCSTYEIERMKANAAAGLGMMMLTDRLKQMFQGAGLSDLKIERKDGNIYVTATPQQVHRIDNREDSFVEFKKTLRAFLLAQGCGHVSMGIGKVMIYR